MPHFLWGFERTYWIPGLTMHILTVVLFFFSIGRKERGRGKMGLQNILLCLSYCYPSEENISELSKTRITSSMRKYSVLQIL